MFIGWEVVMVEINKILVFFVDMVKKFFFLEVFLLIVEFFIDDMVLDVIG